MTIAPVLGSKSLGVKAATLALSVSAHAAIALVAAHGGSSGESLALETPARVELLAPELAVDATLPVEASCNDCRAKVDGHRAHHTHPYPVPPDHDATRHDPSLPHIPLPGRSVEPVAAAPPAAVIAAEPSSAPARFILAIGPTVSEPSNAVPADGRTPQIQPGSAAPMAEQAVDEPATLLSGNAPAYTPEAERAGIETNVPLEIVVDPRGAVIAARSLEHVGYGLDEVALGSIRGYRFKPARRTGNAVAVRMRWIVRFELR